MAASINARHVNPFTQYGPIEISIAMEEKDTLTEIVGIEGELTEV